MTSTAGRIDSEAVVELFAQYGARLFLSQGGSKLRQVAPRGFVVGRFYNHHANAVTNLAQLRIVFDCEAELFVHHIGEARNGSVLMLRDYAAHPVESPAARILKAVASIQKNQQAAKGIMSREIHIALIATRYDGASRRAMSALRAWGIKVDEVFFLGDTTRDVFFNKLNPHIVFPGSRRSAKRMSRPECVGNACR